MLGTVNVVVAQFSMSNVGSCCWCAKCVPSLCQCLQLQRRVLQYCVIRAIQYCVLDADMCIRCVEKCQVL